MSDNLTKRDLLIANNQLMARLGKTEKQRNEVADTLRRLYPHVPSHYKGLITSTLRRSGVVVL